MALLFVAPFALAEEKGPAPSSLKVEKVPEKGTYWVKMTWKFISDMASDEDEPYAFDMKKSVGSGSGLQESTHRLPGDGTTRSWSGTIAEEGTFRGTYTFEVRAVLDQNANSVSPWSDSVSITYQLPE